MNTTSYNIDFDTLIAQHPSIEKHRDKSKTVIYLLFFLVGIAIVLISNKTLATGNEAKLILSSIGICVTGVATIFLIHGGRSYFYQPKKSSMTRGTKFFSRTAEGYFRTLDEKCSEDEWNSPSEDVNGGIKVEYIFDESLDFLMIYPCIYEDLVYYPICKEFVFSGSKARDMVLSLNLNKE